MKQYITEKQFRELSKKERQKLIEWSKTCVSFQREMDEGGYDSSLVVLSIGQMIEFLDENANNDYSRFSMARAPGITKEFVRKWIVGQYNEGFEDALMEKELCDALWQKVKETLHGKYT